MLNLRQLRDCFCFLKDQPIELPDLLFSFQTSSSSSVTEQEKDLRNRYEILLKEKNDRMSRLKDLVKVDKELSAKMKVTPLEVSPELVPSTSQLDLLKSRIQERKKEMVCQ